MAGNSPEQASATPGADSPAPSRRRLVDDLISASAIWYLSGLVVVLGFCFGFYHVEPTSRPSSAPDDPLAAVAVMDGRWYRQIATMGYFYNPRHRSNVAFFPVYPLLGRGLMEISNCFSSATDVAGEDTAKQGVPRPELALLVVSNASFLAALALLARYLRDRWPAAPADAPECTVLVAAFFPTACFFRLAYSESTFLLVSILAFLGMARRWPAWLVSLMVGLGTATRPVGVALLAPLALHLWRRYHGRRARALRTIALSMLGCWGLGAFMAYQHIVFGDALAFAKTQRHWRTAPVLSPSEKVGALLTARPLRDVYDPKSPTFWRSYDRADAPWFSLQFANPLVFAAAIALIVWGACRRWLSLEEVLASALLLLVPYVTRGQEMGMSSMGRFAIVVFPVHMVLARLLCEMPAGVRAALVAGAACIMAAYAALFASGHAIF